MRRTVLVLLVSALAAGVLAAVPASAHVSPNSCGDEHVDGAGWFWLYGHNVGCTRARRVANRWEGKCMRVSCRPGDPISIDVWPGYRCRYEQSGYETVRVRCLARGDRIVHFHWGS